MRNLREMRETILKLKAKGQAIARLQLSGGQPIYINIADRDAINARVNKRYQIPASSSWDVPKN